MVDSCKNDQKVFPQFRKSECGAAIDTAIDNRDALKAKTMVLHISLCEHRLIDHQPKAIDEYCRRIALHNDALLLLQTFNGVRQFVSPTGQCAYNDLAEIARRIVDDQINGLSAQDKAIENHPLKQVVQTCFQPFKLANECQALSPSTTTTPSGTTTTAQAQPSSSDLQQVSSSDQSTKGSTDWYSSIEAIIGFSVGGGVMVLACLAKGIYSCRKKPADDTANGTDPASMEEGRGIAAVDGGQKVAENTDIQKNQRIAGHIYSNEAGLVVQGGNGSVNDDDFTGYPPACTTDEQREEFAEAVKLREILVTNGDQITDQMRRDLVANDIAILELALAQRVEDQKNSD